jgi:hypothetical protein
MLSPGITIVGVALAASVLVEFVQWLLVFRTEKFKHLKQRIFLAHKKLEARLQLLWDVALIGLHAYE